MTQHYYGANETPLMAPRGLRLGYLFIYFPQLLNLKIPRGTAYTCKRPPKVTQNHPFSFMSFLNPASSSAILILLYYYSFCSNNHYSKRKCLIKWVILDIRTTCSSTGHIQPPGINRDKRFTSASATSSSPSSQSHFSLYRPWTNRVHQQRAAGACGQ